MLQPALLLLMLVFPSQSGSVMLQVSVLEGSNVTLHCSAGDQIMTTCWSKENCTNRGCSNETLSDNGKYLIVTLSNEAKRLIIYNIQQKDGGTYCCSDESNQERWIYNLKVIKGCTRDLLNQTDFIGNDISNHRESSASACRETCTQSESCQFFTFKTTTGTCFLKASPRDKKQINVTLIEDTISGYSLRNCSGVDENPMNEESASPSTISTVGPPTSSSSHTPPACLHYYNTSTSWINALVSCEANNCSLVHITNATVQQHVTQLLDQVKLPQGVWIGLERAVLPVNSSRVWTSGPTMIRDSNYTLTWLDACCHEELHFICQDLNH